MDETGSVEKQVYSVLNATVSGVNSHVEMSRLLEEVLAYACGVLRADGGAVMLEDDNRLMVTSACGTSRDSVGEHIPLNAGVAGRAYSSGETLIINDYAEWSGKLNIAPEGIGAAMALPLYWRKAIIGVIAFSRRADEEFAEEDIHKADLFAAQVAIVAGSARLNEAEKAARARARALFDAIEALSSSMRLEEVLKGIIENAARVLPLDSASLAVLEGGEPVIKASYGFPEEIFNDEFSRFGLGTSGMVPRLLASEEPLIVHDVREDPDWVATPSTAQIRGWMGIPLITGGELVGCLMLDSHTPGIYNASHIGIARAMATHAAIAIEKARLLEAERDARTRLEALLSASEALTSMLDVDSVLETIIDSVAEVLPYTSASLMICGHDGDYIHTLRGFDHLDQTTQQRLKRVDFSRSAITASMRETGRPHVIDDVTDHKDWISLPGGHAIRSFMGIPLTLRGEMIAALMLDRSTPHAFTQIEQEYGLAYARQAAIALENANLFEQTRNNLTQTEMLYRMSQALLNADDLTDMLRTFARPFLTQSEAVIVGLSRVVEDPITKQDMLEVIAEVSNLPEFESSTGSRMPLPTTDFRGMGTGLVLVPSVHDLKREAPGAYLTLLRQGIGALASVPLSIGDQVRGSLSLVWQDPRTFTEAEVHHLRLLGPQVSTLFENRLLFEQTEAALSETEALYYGSGQVVRASSFDQVLAALFEGSSLARMERCSMLLFERDAAGEVNTSVARVAAVITSDRLDPLVKPGERIKARDNYTVRLLAEGTRMLLLDLLTDENFSQPERAIIREAGLRAAVTVPLHAGDTLIGGVVAISQKAVRMTEDDLRRIATLADQAAVVVQNLQLFKQTQRALERAEALNRVSHAMVAAEGLEDLLAAFTQPAFDRGASRASFFVTRPEPDGSHLAELLAVRNLPGRPLPRGLTIGQVAPLSADGEADWASSPMGAVLSFNLADAQNIPEWARRDMEAIDTQGVIAVPMHLGDESAVVVLEWPTHSTLTVAMQQFYSTLSSQFATLLENRRLLEETRSARQRFQDVALSMSDAVWEIDMQGQVTYMAGGLMEQLGYEPDEVIGTRIAELVPKADWAAMMRVVDREHGYQFDAIEHRMYHRDGNAYWHEASGVPLYDEDGNLAGYRGVTRHIHPRKEAEQRDAIAYEIGRSLTAVLSLDDLLRQVVTQVYDTLGYYHVEVRLYDRDTDSLVLVEEMSADPVRIRASYEHVPLNAQPSLIAQASRALKPVVSNNVRDDPNHLWTATLPNTRSEVALPLYRGVRLLGVLDVQAEEPERFTPAEVRLLENIAAQASIAVENARLYEALESQAAHLEVLVEERTAQIEKERERVQTIVENTEEGVMLLGESGVEYVNAALSLITGHNFSALIGQLPPLRWLVWMVRSHDALRDLLAAFSTGERWEGDLRVRRPDGSEFDARLTLSPVVDHETANFVALVRDVTAQKEVERMRTRFIENVSHELRTPLANIKLYQTLLRSGSPERRETYLTTLASQISRLERLVEDLLDISRIDRGRMTIKMEWFELNELVQEAYRVHRVQAQEHGLYLEIELGEGLPRVLGDRERLAQVLTNLLTNAINYTEHGDTIGVRTHLLDPGSVLLQVWDTGMGIAPEHQPFIFNRFFRTQRAKDTGKPGTGLGLSIVKEIVEAHAGTITMESAEGEGTTFTVTLPASRA